MTRKPEHIAHCKEIAENLEAIANGYVYKCPDCGEWITEDEYGNLLCNGYNCHYEIEDLEDLEEVSLYDAYIADAFDFEIRAGLDGQFRSCRIMIACGGPNIFIDTRDREVQLYWWNESGSYPLSSDACNALDYLVEELYNC